MGAHHDPPTDGHESLPAGGHTLGEQSVVEMAAVASNGAYRMHPLAWCGPLSDCGSSDGRGSEVRTGREYCEGDDKP